MVQSVTGKASLEIEAVGGASFDGKPLEFVAKLDSVQVASPILRRFSNMQIVRANESDEQAKKREDDKPISYRVQLLGVIPDLDKQVRGYTVVEGKGLTYEESDRQSVLIDAGFAQSARIQVGTQIRLLTRSFGQNATVIG